jgi:hypothetical protein
MADSNDSSVSFNDVAEKLDHKLAHLSAMLCMTYGSSFEAFNQRSDEIRDNYMWGCSTLLDECRQLAADISSLNRL